MSTVSPESASLKALRDQPYELLAELERRGRNATASPETAAEAGSEWVGVAVRMAGELYLVAREEAREVLGVPAPLTRVPGARGWLLGLASLRGQLFPVIDLRLFLGGGATPASRTTRIVVANHRDVPAALVVDEVLGFRRFPENSFNTAVPPTIVPCARFLAGSFLHEGLQLPVLSLRRLLEDSTFLAASALNGSDLVDTGYIRSLVLTTGFLVLLAIVTWLGLDHAGWGLWLPVALAAVSLVPLALLLAQLRALSNAAERQVRAAAQQRGENERNQQAILKLLDEMASLADGDLTVNATVSEDITGAIADSINYAVEALRKLVATINQSAIQVDSAARQSQALAAHLGKASSAQTKQIGSATESIAAMAASTEEVSGNAERAADVARHSVDVAHKGGEAVRRTIDGMNAIRETIQETSKRIKRLGESSQEIGNIVELISDIAEQTNILALNASIQASMAGEAGRGFAVVADEVQRLAERAATATKQIEVLVRTIQADTNEAVVSMERSTTDVVGGALLAENAGAALGEIEQVSNQIASLVQNISGSSRSQSLAAQNIARNTQVLREISVQTSDATSATAQAIVKLADLAAALRKSVAGFRLPADSAAPASATRVNETGTHSRLRVLGGGS